MQYYNGDKFATFCANVKSYSRAKIRDNDAKLDIVLLGFACHFALLGFMFRLLCGSVRDK